MRCFAGVLLTGLLLVACAAPPLDRPLPATAAIAADQAGTRYALDAAQSAVRIHVFRAGRAAHLGHNHVLSVPRLRGLLLVPEGDKAAGARFELSFRLDELVVDEPALRTGLGPGWASLMSAEAIAATRLNMLGEGNLQAERFPDVQLRSRLIAGEWPKLVAELEIELHGQRRLQLLPLQAEMAAGRIKASGSLVLRQSDFGIAPFSVMGGLLAVRDELLIEFELVANRSAQINPSNGSTSTQSPAATSP